MNKWCMGEEILVDREQAIALIPAMRHNQESVLSFLSKCTDNEFIIYRVVDNGVVILDIRRVQ